MRKQPPVQVPLLAKLSNTRVGVNILRLNARGEGELLAPNVNTTAQGHPIYLPLYQCSGNTLHESLTGQLNGTYAIQQTYVDFDMQVSGTISLQMAHPLPLGYPRFLFPICHRNGESGPRSFTSNSSCHYTAEAVRYGGGNVDTFRALIQLYGGSPPPRDPHYLATLRGELLYDLLTYVYPDLRAVRRGFALYCVV